MPFLPVTLRERVVSLVDLAFDALLRGGRKSLLLCTRGTMLTGVFDHHQAWKYARDLLMLPNHEDQETVHDLIYEIKMNGPDARHLSILDFLMRKYQVSSYTAACTELHILTRERARVTGCNSNDFSIDPLVIAASMMSQSAGVVYAGSGE
jgi:aspartate racemase